MRIYTAVSLQQDEFRTNRFYFLPVTIPVFCRYAQKAVRLCSCGDQAVTHRHTHTHKKNTITLRLRARVNDEGLTSEVIYRRMISNNVNNMFK